MLARLREAFTEMAKLELPRLRRFAYGVCGDWYRADDLVQGALERMYVAWPRIHLVVDPGAYARTVVVRLAISESRRHWRRRERTTDVVPEVPVPDAASGVDTRIDLAQALAGLTVKQRAVVVLRYVEDRPVAEVASILGIAPGTVKRQSHDALIQMRSRLGDPRSSPRSPGEVADHG